MDKCVSEHNGREMKYWFTKVKDYYSHDQRILNSVASPDGSTLATLGSDDEIRLWNLFEKV